MKAKLMQITLTVLITGLFLPVFANAQTQGNVQLSTNKNNASPGEQITVTVTPSDFDSFYAVQLDTGKLEFTGEHTADNNPEGLTFVMLSAQPFTLKANIPQNANPGDELTITGLFWNDPNDKINIEPVKVTVKQTATISLTIVPTSLTVPENNQAQFGVKLSAQPTSTITVSVTRTSGDTDISVQSGSTLAFTASDWDTYQTVTVAAEEDPDTENGTAVIRVSSDGLNPEDVTITESDNDNNIPVLSVTPVIQEVSATSGTTAFTVANTGAGAMPWKTSKNTEWFSISPISGTDSGTITVSYQANPGDERTGTIKITSEVAQGSPKTVEIIQAGISVIAGFTVQPKTGLKTTEDGGTATFTVKLARKPTADVTIALYSLDDSEAAVSHQSLTFTPQNWNSNQIIIVTGMDDDITDGDVGYNVVLTPAVSTDPEYSGLDPADVSLVNIDNDTGSVTGDIDGDGDVELTDAVLALMVLSGTDTSNFTIRSEADANQDGKIGTEELVYVLQVVAEIVNKTSKIIASFDSSSGYCAGLTFDGNYLWNADTSDKAIYKSDIFGNSISSFYSPGILPQGLTFDGKYLWNADADADKIYKLDTFGNITGSFDSPGTWPTGLAFDGTYLWNADWDNQKIYKLDTSGNIKNSFNSPGTWPTGLAFDGKYLWNADGYGKIYKLDTSGNITDTFNSPGNWPNGLAFDGTYLWNADRGDYLSHDTGKIYKLEIPDSP